MFRITRSNIAGIIVGTVLVGGLAVGAAIEGPVLAASIHHAQYLSAEDAAQKLVPAAPAGDATTGQEQTTLAQSDAAGAQVVVTEQQKEAAAAALAAQQAAVAAQRVRDSNIGSDGLIVCPAGSTADAGDSSGATLCLPDICFHVTLPDPAYPQCVTAFKP